MPAELDLHPIGVVRNGVVNHEDRRWEELVSRIVLSEDYAPGLEGIEAFSHIFVLFWMHKLARSERGVVKVHPFRRDDLPLVGVFATRSPARPNPLGLTVVRLLNKQRNELTVKGLDALDGSPVVDIKPYLSVGDCHQEATGAEWVAKGRGLHG